MKDGNTVTLDRIPKLVDVDLDDDEIRERADIAAQLSAQADRAREARKLAAKQAQQEIDRMENDMRIALSEVRRRKTEREVECEVLLNPSERSVSIVRMDTGEVIHTRPARESELQIELVPPRREAAAS